MFLLILLAVTMVTVCPSNNSITGNSIVYWTIPVIDIFGETTISCIVVWRLTAFELPLSVFCTVFVVTFNTTNEMVHWTIEEHRFIKIINISFPSCFVKFCHCSLTTMPFPLAILFTIGMSTLYTIYSLLITTFHFQ